MRSRTRRDASSADSSAGALLVDVDVDVVLVGVLVAEEVVDVVEVAEVVVEVVVGAAPDVGWPPCDSASAVPAVTVSAPATMAPTRSFLVMPFLPSLFTYQQRCR
jgi:hypothetical protein